MNQARRIRPRRVPRFQVVGGEPATRLRHLAVLDWDIKHAGHRSVVLEFWTDAEWARLGEWERPERVNRVPGLGYVKAFLARDEQDAEDHRDLVRQVRELLEGAEGE